MWCLFSEQKKSLKLCEVSSEAGTHNKFEGCLYWSKVSVGFTLRNRRCETCVIFVKVSCGFLNLLMYAHQPGEVTILSLNV